MLHFDNFLNVNISLPAAAMCVYSMRITGSSDIAPHGHRCLVQGGSHYTGREGEREGDTRSPDVVLCGSSSTCI